LTAKQAPEKATPPAGVPLRDEDYLVLSTIHSAKGQEWKSVFVLNVVDGCLPSDLATGTTSELEEERRLLSDLAFDRSAPGRGGRYAFV
jgi:ATP-dependent DNA helicase UvrD/PcrA